VKKRVLYHIKSLSSGGAQRQLLYTALAAEREGYEAKIVIDSPTVQFGDMLRGSGVEVVMTCPGPARHRTAKRVMTLSRLIRAYRPEIVHSFLPRNNLWASLVSSFHGVPVKIASIRNTDRNAFKYLRLYRTWTDKIVCNSRIAAEIAMKEYGVPQEKLAVIYNAIDLGRFAEARELQGFKAKLGMPEQTRLGITVASLAHRKNHIGLVRALAILERERLLDGIHFLFAGKPEDSEYCRKILDDVEQYGLSRRVTVLGAREDVPELLKCCEFMVLPSFFEGFPNAVIEAMASGLFVVATPTGGTPELVEDRVNGLLTRGCAPEDLADGVRAYLRLAEADRRRIVDAARERVRPLGHERAFESVFELYEGATTEAQVPKPHLRRTQGGA